MTKNLKSLLIRGQNSLILVFFLLIFIILILGISSQKVEANPADRSFDLTKTAISQGNTLTFLSNPANPDPKVIGKMKVVVTAYSSTPWETDDTPLFTASGEHVRDGIVANNYLPFGTKIRIPEVYGEKIFIVEDRMHWSKDGYYIDIWFSSYPEALNFGAKRTYIEILES